MKRAISLFLTLCICTATAFLFSSCQMKRQKISGFLQGSYYEIAYYTANPGLKDENLQPGIDSILRAFDRCLSTRYENSDINRVNRNEKFQPSEMFCDIFTKAMEMSQLTDGAFDVTISPLVQLYGFTSLSPKRNNPTEKEVSDILEYVGWKKVHLEDGYVIKDDPRIQLDFSGIAHGYAACLIGFYLRERGIESYLVNIGGKEASRGIKPGARLWMANIEKPTLKSSEKKSVMQRLFVLNRSVSTDGYYREFFEKEGVRYTHTIDPKTGALVQRHMLSATALGNFCWEVDALSTACMVMGVDKSKEFLDEHPEYQVYLVYSDEDGGLLTWNTVGFPLI